MKKKNRQRLVSLGQAGKNPDASAESEIRPNDYKVLDTLDDPKNVYTFRGIIRKTGMHQETLTRSLQRLQESGFVSKTKLGYKISNKIQNLSKSQGQDFIPILMSYLPPSITSEKIVNKIAGKWFEEMRWVGITKDDDYQTLQWINDLVYVNLKILSNHLVVETSAKTEKDKVGAMIGACRIVQKVMELYDEPLIQTSVFAN